MQLTRLGKSLYQAEQAKKTIDHLSILSSSVLWTSLGPLYLAGAVQSNILIHPFVHLLDVGQEIERLGSCTSLLLSYE